MKRMIRLVRDQLMRFCTHHHIRRFDTDDEIVIAHLLDDPHFVERALHQALCRYAVVFFHQLFFE